MFPSDALRAALDGSGSVVVFGDLHGDATGFRTLAERTAELGLTRVLVSVGDFGIGPWSGAPEDRFLQRVDQMLEKHDLYVLLTPGNHENWDTIDRALAERVDELGFGALGRHGRVRVSPRGHRFSVGGRVFGSLGGAVSVDRSHRVAGRSWWAQEAVTAEHVAALGSAPLDVLVTHEAPAGVPLKPGLQVSDILAAEAHGVRTLVADAVRQTRPELAFCGHWHVRLSHDLIRPDGSVTRVEVLSEEHTVGNAVVLELYDLGVTPLPTLWRSHLER